jgi:hypothetical protein
MSLHRGWSRVRLRQGEHDGVDADAEPCAVEPSLECRVSVDLPELDVR